MASSPWNCGMGFQPVDCGLGFQPVRRPEFREARKSANNCPGTGGNAAAREPHVKAARNIHKTPKKMGFVSENLYVVSRKTGWVSQNLYVVSRKMGCVSENLYKVSGKKGCGSETIYKGSGKMGCASECSHKCGGRGGQMAEGGTGRLYSTCPCLQKNARAAHQRHVQAETAQLSHATPDESCPGYLPPHRNLPVQSSKMDLLADV